MSEEGQWCQKRDSGVRRGTVVSEEGHTFLHVVPLPLGQSVELCP